MLVLSRRLGQSIEIDGGILITVLSIRNGQVRLGIEAPKETKIRRSELAKLEEEGESEEA